MLHKESDYVARVYRQRWDELKAGKDTILLPGTMGSELHDLKAPDTVWMDVGVWHEIDDLEFDELRTDGARDIDSQLILARSTLRPPIVRDPYAEFLALFATNAGPRAVTFPFDWREDVLIEAQRFESFLRRLAPGGSHHVRGKTYNLVTHSLGGCVVALVLGVAPNVPGPCWRSALSGTKKNPLEAPTNVITAAIHPNESAANVEIVSPNATPAAPIGTRPSSIRSPDKRPARMLPNPMPRPANASNRDTLVSLNPMTSLPTSSRSSITKEPRNSKKVIPMTTAPSRPSPARRRTPVMISAQGLGRKCLGAL